jgi:hypothetical protein
MPMPTFPLARLGGFRAELHACFTRHADALFEFGDALLCAQAIPSLPHLSLEPVHQRGWGSVYAALARGRIDTERLRGLLASALPDVDPLVFAVDVTTWPRCDAECSPERGYYYHPSRHSAGQPIIAGWPTSGSPSWASTVTPGPPRSTRPGCTPGTTPTSKPQHRSARCWHGCPPARPCRCSSSTAAPQLPRIRDAPSCHGAGEPLDGRPAARAQLADHAAERPPRPTTRVARRRTQRPASDGLGPQPLRVVEVHPPK